MAYNYGFPATYQPVYQYTQAPTQPTNRDSAIIWVQGEAGAKSYLVAPNSTVQLWDSESQVIYLKSADASGMPSMRILDYTIRDSNKTSPISPSGLTDDKLSTFATKEEIKAISDRISALRKRIDKLTKEEEENE